MKSLRILLAAIASSVTLGGVASAQGLFNFEPVDGYFYLAGFVGVAVPDDVAGISLDTDVNYGGAIGAQLPFKSLNVIHTRIEAEVSYFETGLGDFAGGPSIDNLFIYGNSFADFIWRENQAVIPYIGGGLGVAITDTDQIGSDTNFSNHTTIGLTVPINNLDLYAEGRYFQIFADGPNPDGFTFSGGLRWKF